MKLVVYRETNGDFRWSLRASNGQQMANGGEGYRRRIDMVTAIQTVLGGTLSGGTFIRQVSQARGSGPGLAVDPTQTQTQRIPVSDLTHPREDS